MLNFGGQNSELWCRGGEVEFIRNMVRESATIGSQCCWFTSLVSKSAHLPAVYAAIDRAGARAVRTVDMFQGQKQSRFVAWSFLSAIEMEDWRKNLNFKP